MIGAEDRETQRQFIDFPYEHYKNDPYWAPPLRIAQKDMLDQKKHPFYVHAEMKCFIARQGSQVVGRIAAILDRNQFAPDNVGFFGFLEMTESQPVANALLQAA